MRHFREGTAIGRNTLMTAAMRGLSDSDIADLAHYLSTVDRHGGLDVSPKGDAPGFVLVLDEKTLLVPDRTGNRLVFGFQNVLETGNIGLSFLVPGVRETLRVNGTAVLTRDPALLERCAVAGKPALLCTRVTVREAFVHCGKAMIRSALWQPDRWRAGGAQEAPVRQLASVFGADESALRESLERSYRDGL